jgi:hypothetical protein
MDQKASKPTADSARKTSTVNCGLRTEKSVIFMTAQGGGS